MHKGEYGLYNYEHHNCFHNSPLAPIVAEDGYYMCGEYGETFRLKFEGSDWPKCGEEWVSASGYKESDISWTYSRRNQHDWEGPARPFKIQTFRFSTSLI